MSTTPISTDTNGNQAVGTAGTTLSNSSSTQLSSNEFLDLMMTELTHQDPTNPDSSDPTQYLSQLAQLTSVEQETDTAQSTAESATEAAVSQSVGLIGDSVTYVDQKTGDSVTGTVNSVQITSSGPTLTIDGVAGIDPAYVVGVQPAGSSDTSSTSGTNATSNAAGTGSSALSGTQGASSVLGNTGTAGTGGTSDTTGTTSTSGSGAARRPPVPAAPARPATRSSSEHVRRREQPSPTRTRWTARGPSAGAQASRWQRRARPDRSVRRRPVVRVRPGRSDGAGERADLLQARAGPARPARDRLDGQTLGRLTEGIQRAAGKGSRNSVVFVDGTAFVASVQNNTVITAVTPGAHARARVHQHRQRRDRMST